MIISKRYQRIPPTCVRAWTEKKERKKQKHTQTKPIPPPPPTRVNNNNDNNNCNNNNDNDVVCYPTALAREYWVRSRLSV